MEFVESDVNYEEWYNNYIKNTNPRALTELKTSAGIAVAKLSKDQHGRADLQNIDLVGIRDALINPLHVGEVLGVENGNS